MKQALEPHLGWHGARLSFLALFLLALLKVKTVNLKELALGFEGPALVDSHYKRLQRFFSGFELDYHQIARIVVSWLDICLESTHFTDPKRLRKLLALLTLALAWSLKTGLAIHHLHPIPLKKHGRRAQSLFRLGFDHLRHLVLNPSSPNFSLFLDSLHFLSCT